MSRFFQKFVSYNQEFYIPFVTIATGIGTASGATYGTYESVKNNDDLIGSVIGSVFYGLAGGFCACIYTTLYPITVPSTLIVGGSKIYRYGTPKENNEN